MEKYKIFLIGVGVVVLMIALTMFIFPGKSTIIPPENKTQNTTSGIPEGELSLRENVSSFCGNGVCNSGETCSTCPEDCGCKTYEHCDKSGICLTSPCGDGVCTEYETEHCCLDCGCDIDNEICSYTTRRCVTRAKLSDEKVNETVTNYLNKNQDTARSITVYDADYQGMAVKAVTIDCRGGGWPEDIPCIISLYINENGDVVHEARA